MDAGVSAMSAKAALSENSPPQVVIGELRCRLQDRRRNRTGSCEVVYESPQNPPARAPRRSYSRAHTIGVPSELQIQLVEELKSRLSVSRSKDLNDDICQHVKPEPPPRASPHPSTPPTVDSESGERHVHFNAPLPTPTTPKTPSDDGTRQWPLKRPSVPLIKPVTMEKLRQSKHAEKNRLAKLKFLQPRPPMMPLPGRRSHSASAPCTPKLAPRALAKFPCTEEEMKRLLEPVAPKTPEVVRRLEKSVYDDLEYEVPKRINFSLQSPDLAIRSSVTESPFRRVVIERVREYERKLAEASPHASPFRVKETAVDGILWSRREMLN